MTTVAAGRPRVLRKVKKHNAKGQPKMARDMRLNIDVEWVRAVTRHTCDVCSTPIEDSVYLKVYLRNRLRRMGPHVVPETEDLHVACLGRPLRPLLRLLKLS